MNCLVDTPYFCNRQRQTARTLLDLQGAHDVHGGDTAELERSDEPEHIVPMRCDPVKVDALTRQNIEFAVIGLCVDAPEARTACHAALKSRNHACLFSILFPDL